MSSETTATPGWPYHLVVLSVFIAGLRNPCFVLNHGGFRRCLRIYLVKQREFL